MLTTKNLTTIYYVLAVCLLIGQAVYTVYQHSLAISFGPKVAQLTEQKQKLQKQYHLLQHQLGNKMSLNYQQNQLDEGFKNISDPIVITVNREVASR